MKLIFGLGNPEPQFDKTPHNSGFLTLDKLAEKLGANFSKKKLGAIIAESSAFDEKVLLIKPQTYMNKSGECVLKFVKKFKVPLSNCLVIFDDIDLPAGTIRFREKGSGGTHNGMRNVVLNVGQDIPRLRVGVGKPEGINLADYVLKKLSGEHLAQVENGCALASQKALEFLETGIQN